jgi:hypothetical protein
MTHFKLPRAFCVENVNTNQLLGVRRHIGDGKSKKEWNGKTRISVGEHGGHILN